ncbi:hypothetical protein PBY51_021663 [Eleginops maclovinus]|uniref:Uncharacterized protein n=1 Tax=Eleginops maclovinus TaxID=56733 RepID=A0AAN7XFY9_ELEMC|nr:hypothetical protein PBY51_021663 [Eleginops maclovinus]
MRPLLRFPLQLTCQLCRWLAISWGLTYLLKKEGKYSDEEWIQKNSQKKERQPKIEGGFDKCAFEESISMQASWLSGRPLSSLLTEDPSQQMKAGASLRWCPSIIPASCIR